MDANSDSEEISLKDLISNFIKAFHYLKSKWLLILIFGIIGGASGLLYSFFKKPIYTATSTFVLEDNKSNGMGQYSGLASLAGIDIGSSSSNGIFQGDNLLELYKSRLMIQKTLLSSVNVNGKQQLLIDRYIEFNHMREKWKTKPQLAYINFFENPDRFTRQQDSIIQNIVQTFNKKLLVVTKPDKKLSIIQVDVSSKDEIFSKEFNNKLVETVNDFYTQTKTKKSSQNIRVLQKQADSVRNVLNSSLDGVA
ncbi:lipopolysaccharide biosynthesis protein, partial [bacterium]